MFLNLSDQIGYEQPLTNELEQQIKNAKSTFKDSLDYVLFDFHRECRRMQWHKLSLMLEKIVKQLDSYGYEFVFKHLISLLFTWLFLL